MKKTIAVSMLAIDLLVGCSTYKAPTFYKATEAEIAAADFGPYPDRYQELIKEHMQQILKDPESARYRFTSPPTKFARMKTNANEPFQFYWKVDYFVNAKNSYGGYIGEHNYIGRIRNNVVLGVDDMTKTREDLDRFLRR